MTFDSERHTVHGNGNAVVHHPSEGEVRLTVLGAGLSDAALNRSTQT